MSSCGFVASCGRPAQHRGQHGGWRTHVRVVASNPVIREWRDVLLYGLERDPQALLGFLLVAVGQDLCGDPELLRRELVAEHAAPFTDHGVRRHHADLRPPAAVLSTVLSGPAAGRDETAGGHSRSVSLGSPDSSASWYGALSGSSGQHDGT